MLAAESLAARSIAILTSRLHNAKVYALRGCEDLDSRYAALRKVLHKARLPLPTTPDFDAAGLHEQLLRRVHSDAAFGAKLESAIATEFPSAFE